MRESKALIVLLIVVFALPIPLSLLSWIGTLISIANIGMTYRIHGALYTYLFIAAMLLAGTYLITYVIFLLITLKKKSISLISLLPLAHIILFLLIFLAV